MKHALLTIFVMATLGSTSAQLSRPQSLSDLSVIGERVAQAVLRKDVPALMAFEWERKAENEQELKDPMSWLSCFLFDTTCNDGRPSIREVLSKAKKMTVTVKDVGIGRHGDRYALVLFYDASVISKKQLNSERVLCRENGHRIVSWLFQLQAGRWVGAHEPFDAETDTLCQPR
jgi:hypothetical protein